jgi:hypothetical protein
VIQAMDEPHVAVQIIGFAQRLMAWWEGARAPSGIESKSTDAPPASCPAPHHCARPTTRRFFGKQRGEYGAPFCVRIADVHQSDGARISE